MAYSLREVDLSAERWEEAIRSYETKKIFHDPVWLAHLERTQNGERLLLAIRQGETLVGYFCGVLIRRGPFLVLGSPLRGWWTPCMGPIVNELDDDAFVAGLDDFCRVKGIDYVEMCAPVLSPESLEAAGYESDHDITFLIELDEPETMWKRVNVKARNKVRQAEKKGVRIERAQEESVVDEYYAQLKGVFERQSLSPPHPSKMVRSLWNCLYPEGKLLMLRALHEEQCVATYLGVVDEKVLYGLGWASWPSAYPLRPNDLMQWTALTMAAEKGLAIYDMCGGGSFKPKFGGREVPRIRWRKAFSRSALMARELYKAYWFGRRQVMQRLRQIRSAGKSGRGE